MEIWQSRRGKNSRNSEENVGGEVNGRHHKNRIVDTTDREFHIQRTGKTVGRGGNTSTMFMRGCHWKEQTCHSMNRKSKKQSKKYNAIGK